MDPKPAWILRPGGVSLVGTLVLFGALFAGAARAASEIPQLRPDAPPGGTVIVPAPDAPAAAARTGGTRIAAPEPRHAASVSSSSGAASVVRSHVVPVRSSRAPAVPRGGNSAKAPITAKHEAPPPAPAPLRHGPFPDGVGAFVAGPVAEAARSGANRGIVALAGVLLAFVALGGGCLTLAVARVEQER
jgi:hypothetical protein